MPDSPPPFFFYLASDSAAVGSGLVLIRVFKSHEKIGWSGCLDPYQKPFLRSHRVSVATISQCDRGPYSQKGYHGSPRYRWLRQAMFICVCACVCEYITMYTYAQTHDYICKCTYVYFIGISVYSHMNSSTCICVSRIRIHVYNLETQLDEITCQGHISKLESKCL